jgi:hypothetical protein
VAGGNEVTLSGFGPLLDWVPAFMTNMRTCVFVSVRPARHNQTVIMQLEEDCLAISFRKIRVPVKDYVQALLVSSSSIPMVVRGDGLRFETQTRTQDTREVPKL